MVACGTGILARHPCLSFFLTLTVFPALTGLPRPRWPAGGRKTAIDCSDETHIDGMLLCVSRIVPCGNYRHLPANGIFVARSDRLPGISGNGADLSVGGFCGVRSRVAQAAALQPTA